MRARIIFSPRGFAHPNCLFKSTAHGFFAGAPFLRPEEPDEALREVSEVLTQPPMKLKLAGSGTLVLLFAAITVGCSPSQAAKPKAPDAFAAMDSELLHAMGPDAIAAMDSELSHTIVGTTTLTSGTIDLLPESRMPVSEARENEPSAPAVQTWGDAPAPSSAPESIYKP